MEGGRRKRLERRQRDRKSEGIGVEERENEGW